MPLCKKPITKDNPIVGAHVQKVASTDENYYIVPLCRSCNSSGNFSFNIDEDYLVRARKEYCITEII